MDRAQDLSDPRPPFSRSQSDSSSSRTLNAPSYSLKASVDENKPRRPPRNPARAGPDVEPETVTGKRVKTATGTQEEVTPWELHPPPASYSTVAPPASNRISIRPSTSGGHNYGPGISFSDLSLLRRRKSTGSKQPSKAKPTLSSSADPGPPVTSGSGSPSQSSHNSTTNGNGSPRLTQKIATVISPHPHPRLVQQPQTPSHTTSSLPTAHRSRKSTSTYNAPPKQLPGLASSPGSKSSSKSSFEKQPDHQSSSNNLRFSTADRTILEELKRNISARASQFVVKGPSFRNKKGHESGQGSLGGSGEGYGGGLGLSIEMNVGGLGVVGGGRKHHPYEKEEVPYPRSYDRDVLDLDVWETLFHQQICESLTWHVFEEPPTKVLDLGCGTGSWILDCARAWRKCHFVGLDVVPVQPDLQQVGSADLAHRVTWVQGNFLDGLPFPNEEFDFVHVKRISLGVPEDKWDSLLEEITRVMKPGAAFEMIEEDLLFPGRVVQNEDENESVVSYPRYYDGDSAYFSDSDTRTNSSTSYFTRGLDGRNRNRPRSVTSAASSSPTMKLTGGGSTRRRSVPGRGAKDSRRSVSLEYATLTALMGLSDVENDIVESEREDEENLGRGDSDKDSSLANTSGFQNSSAGDQERVSAGLLFPVSPSKSQTSPGTSPVSPSPSTLPSPSLSVPSFLASPISLSKLPVITTATGRGVEVEAIAEDEEGEKSAILDYPSSDTAPDTNDYALHFQQSTDSTITPASVEVSSMFKPINLGSVSPSPRSPQPRHYFSASTGSLTDLQLSNPIPTNSHSITLPPRRPLSANGSSTQSPSFSFSQSMLSLSSNPQNSPVDEFGARSPGGKPAAPFVLRALPKPPVNPRDHSMLETIYNEMNAARFVNLSPLSLLPNLLGLHFKDVRTHAPVLFTFPPRPVVEQSQPSLRDNSDPDEDAQEAIRPTPFSSMKATAMDPSSDRRMSKTDFSASSPTGSPPGSTTRASYFEEGSDNEYDHWISMQQIIKRESPYIVYDGSRLSAFSPSTRASFHSPTNALPGSRKHSEANSDVHFDSEIVTSRGNSDLFSTKSPKPELARDIRFRLPNTTMHIDLRSLNLHLSLRTTEILACSETMWEWVLEYQKQTRQKKRSQESRWTRVRSRSIESSTRPPSLTKQPESNEDRLMAAISELTREEFNDILRRFCLDMQEHMAIPSALEERFRWSAFPTSPADRKVFDAEEERYLEWEAEQNQRKSLSSHTIQSRPLSASFPTPPPLHSTPILEGLRGSYSETLNGGSRRNSTSSHSTQCPPIVPPSRRLSRSLRIFVAWKGLEAS